MTTSTPLIAVMARRLFAKELGRHAIQLDVLMDRWGDLLSEADLCALRDHIQAAERLNKTLGAVE